MEFTYSGYKKMIELLHNHDYVFTDYLSDTESDRKCILRHDVDFDLEKAADFSDFEKSIGLNVKSTYFVLCSSDFYNVCSQKSLTNIQRIIANGHTVGLHFDEEKYAKTEDAKFLSVKINEEVRMLSEVTGYQIKTVSMHRPSKQILDYNLKINGLVNSYSEEYFAKWKYISDSRMKWKDDISSIIIGEGYNALHILTHPFWYYEREMQMKSIFLNFIDTKKYSLYQSLSDNIRDFQSVLRWEEVI